MSFVEDQRGDPPALLLIAIRGVRAGQSTVICVRRACHPFPTHLLKSVFGSIALLAQRFGSFQRRWKSFQGRGGAHLAGKKGDR